MALWANSLTKYFVCVLKCFPRVLKEVKTHLEEICRLELHLNSRAEETGYRVLDLEG